MNFDKLLFDFSIREPIPATPGELANQTSIPRLPSVIRSAMEELAKSLRIHFENQADAFLEQQISAQLCLNIIQTPPNSPFHGTDLILFKDTFTGPLPSNGIRLTQFQEMESVYQRILNKQSNIRISGGGKPFEDIIHEQIKILMTRDIGRQLWYEIINHQDKVLNILPTTDMFRSSVTRYSRSNKEATIHLGLEPFQVLVQGHYRGYLRGEQMPLFLTLGHECIHALNIFNSPHIDEWKKIHQRSATLDPRYTNLEEQRTIQSENIISENRLRSAFGHPLRFGHQGLTVRPSGHIHQPEMVHYFTQVCSLGLLDEIIDLLYQGMDTNAVYLNDKAGMTPLMYAAQGGHTGAFYLLQAAQANHQLRDLNGLTLLHYAVESGQVGFVEDLIRRGIVNIAEADQTSMPIIFHTIVKLGKKCGPMVDLLIHYGAFIHAIDEYGNTALHYAAALEDLTLFNKLADSELSIDVPNHHGLRPIHMALHHGNLPLFYRLCRTALDFYQLTPCGKNLMFFAMESGKKEVVEAVFRMEQLFAATFVPPNLPPFIMIEKFDMNRRIPSSHAFVNAFNQEGQDFILHLVSHNLLHLHASNLDQFISLFATADSPIREQTLDKIIKTFPFVIDQGLCFGKSLLRWAIQERDLGLAEFAVSRGARVNTTASQEVQSTPLHDAVDRNDPDIVRLLLSKGADATTQDYQGRTPLQIILEKQVNGGAIDINVFNMLIAARAKILEAVRQQLFPDLNEPG